MRVYSVYDCKAEASVSQFFCKTRGLALRQFIDAVQNPESPFSKHPGDFSLFEVAEFDERTQLVEGYDAVHNLGSALEYVKEGRDD